MTGTTTLTNPRAGGICRVDPGTPPAASGAGAVIETSNDDNTCGPDSITINAADLTAVKSHTPAGSAAINVPFTWTIRAANTGSDTSTFVAGTVILRDNLPNANITYGPVQVVNLVSMTNDPPVCTINGTFDLVCVAGAGNTTFGLATGRFDVQFTATATVAANYANPRAGGVCRVDPDSLTREANAAGTGETNNDCSETVTVGGPPTATFTVSKDFTDNSAGVAQITLTCTGATPDAPTKPASENPNSPAVFTVSSIAGGATCTASEGAITGYTQQSTTCTPGMPVTVGATPSCAFVNQTAAAANADLSLIKTGGTGNLAPGANVTYTLILTNNGPGTANNVVVTDPVPANTTFVSASQTSGPAFTMVTPAVGGTGNVQFSAATMANGLSAVFSITVRVNAAAANGAAIVNAATVSSASDPTAGNNAPTVSGTVSIAAARTATPTASPTPTPVNVPSRIPPQIYQNPGVQGIIYGNRSTPVPRPAVAPAGLPTQ